MVVAAGALGTNLLLARCKYIGALAISDRLGHMVRTNSESLTAVTAPQDRGWSNSVAITSSFHPAPTSHSETVTYGAGADMMGRNGSRTRRAGWRRVGSPRRCSIFIPVTAYILGGAIPAISPDRGVIDMNHNVFGYRNLMVCDGSAVPANPGANPSLTITAMAERAMAAVPTAMSAR